MFLLDALVGDRFVLELVTLLCQLDDHLFLPVLGLEASLFVPVFK